MARSEAARTQYGRPHDDQQDDLTNAERALMVPLQGRMDQSRATALPMRSRSGPCCRRGAVVSDFVLSSVVFQGAELVLTPDATTGP